MSLCARIIPSLFSAIQQRVAEGRWEITGDMWIEADCNLSGGELTGTPVFAGQDFFSRTLRHGDVFARAVATGCFRVCLGIAAVDQGGRS